MLPVVEPGAALPPERLARYSRQLMLPGFDETAQRRLANARVLVIGGGGLGSAAIPYLASAGIGIIGVIDDDVVELSNLHRQVSHGTGDIGRRKVDSIADTIAAIDPDATVHRHDVHLDAGNALGIFAGYDIVLDGSDNFATRYLSSDAAQLSGTPLVWGAILRYSGQAGVSWAARGPSYRDLFPSPPQPGEIPSCAEGGVLPGVAATIGAIMATEALKLITGIGEPLIGRVTSYDALTGRFRELEYERDPEAAAVTALIDYDAFCGVAATGTPTGTRDDGLVSPVELARRLDAGAELQLIDVREPYEASIARIEGSELIPLRMLGESLGRLRRDVPVVVLCHLGVRSREAARILRRAGFTDVDDLSGGIDAYAMQVDPSLARY